MSSLKVNSVVDAAGGNTVTVNGYIPTMSNMAGRNRIINGDMRVAQRGTSGTTTSSGYVSLDRWRAYISTSSTVTLSQQTFTPGQTEVAGSPEYFMRYDWLGTGSPSTKIVMQRVENVSSLVGVSTLSFYAKTEIGDDINVEVYQNFGSGGSTEVTVLNQTVDVGSAWAKYTITFTLPSLSGKTIGTSSYIELAFASRNTTANSYLDLAQVQLEEGSVATPFEHRQYGQELALCQRYFISMSGSGSNPAIGVGLQINTTSTTVVVPLPTTMRSVPTIGADGTLATTDTYSYNTGATLTAAIANNNSAQLTMSTSSVGAQGRPAFLVLNTSSASKLNLTAEL